MHPSWLFGISSINSRFTVTNPVSSPVVSCLTCVVSCFFSLFWFRTNVTQIALFHFKKICSKNIQRCCFIELFFVESQTVQSLANIAPRREKSNKKQPGKNRGERRFPPTSNNQMPLTMPLAKCKRSIMKFFSQLNERYKHLLLRGRHFQLPYFVCQGFWFLASTSTGNLSETSPGKGRTPGENKDKQAWFEES